MAVLPPLGPFLFGIKITWKPGYSKLITSHFREFGIIFALFYTSKHNTCYFYLTLHSRISHRSRTFGSPDSFSLPSRGLRGSTATACDPDVPSAKCHSHIIHRSINKIIDALTSSSKGGSQGDSDTFWFAP